MPLSVTQIFESELINTGSESLCDRLIAVFEILVNQCAC